MNYQSNFSRPKFNTKPTIIKHDNRKDPPYETNGKGSPLTGIIPAVIAQFIKTCVKKIVAIPTKTREENRSAEFTANRIIFIINHENSTNIISKVKNINQNISL